MRKKSKFDNTNKWYMHNPASVLENDMHKLLWDFDIQTNHVISARRPDFIVIKKKKLQNWGLAKELKKLWNMKVIVIPIMIGAFGTVTKGLLKGLEDLEIRRRVATIQTTVLFRTARILRRVLET